MNNNRKNLRRAARSTRLQKNLAAVCLFCSCSSPTLAATAESIEPQASGVFLNADGDVLTARHAVAGCHSLYVIKDGKVVMATLRAVNDADDIAVLATALKPLLSAVFQRSALPPDRSVTVFFEAYSRLLSLPDRAFTLSNAITVPGDGGELQLLSGAKPGTSGSAVLSSGGLVLGMAVERIASAPSVAGMAQAHVRNPAQTDGGTLVKAVPASTIKHFLRAADIGFAESDVAQIGARQSPAARAFTLGAGVICG